MDCGQVLEVDETVVLGDVSYSVVTGEHVLDIQVGSMWSFHVSTMFGVGSEDDGLSFASIEILGMDIFSNAIVIKDKLLQSVLRFVITQALEDSQHFVFLVFLNLQVAAVWTIHVNG